jgi:AcrR family transcriptional regulator
MGRKRTVDQQDILNAAERVVASDGAANLTLDKVASAAGVSKATVLYDFKSKQAVLEAVVERAFERDNALHASVLAKLEQSGHGSVASSRIIAAAAPPAEAFRNAALNLSAALVLDEALREKMQANQAVIIKAIESTETSPRGALLAYLALEGLKLLEHFDFHHFDGNERARILREIHWLATASPAETPLPLAN